MFKIYQKVFFYIYLVKGNGADKIILEKMSKTFDHDQMRSLP